MPSPSFDAPEPLPLQRIARRSASALEVRGEEITAVRPVVNPDKLRRLNMMGQAL